MNSIGLPSVSRGRFFGAAVAALAALIAVAIPREGRSADSTPPPFARYRCTICDHIYSEAEGDPVSKIPAGTRWADVPNDWVCPDCGAAKADFVLMAD